MDDASRTEDNPRAARRQPRALPLLSVRLVVDLNFPLLSDWNAETVHAFDVVAPFREFEDVAERSAFLVDPDGTVRGSWRYGTSELPDIDVLLAAARD